MGIKVITSHTVREQVITDISFDHSYFDKYIELAQKKYLKPALGKDFYNDYLNTYPALSAPYQTLKDEFIDKLLSYYIVYEAFPEVRDKLTNQGVMHNRSEFTEQTPSFDYGQLRSVYNYNGNFWVNEMIEFILENPTDYPLFGEDCSSDNLNSNNKGFIIY